MVNVHRAVATSETSGVIFTMLDRSENTRIPDKFSYPFYHNDSKICKIACEKVMRELDALPSNGDSEKEGRMFGVLVARTASGCLGYLKAYSGIDSTALHGYCPPVFDVTQEKTFQQLTLEINKLKKQIAQLEDSDERTQLLARSSKAQEEAAQQLEQVKNYRRVRKRQRKEYRMQQERILSPEKLRRLEAEIAEQSAYDQRYVKEMKAKINQQLAEDEALLKEIDGKIDQLSEKWRASSANLKTLTFGRHRFLNILGEKQSLLELFADTPLKEPPPGSGNCAPLKLLQTAFLLGYVPVSMSQFWWGCSDIRKHGFYYPVSRGMCEPVLNFMLRGIAIQDNPILDQVSAKVIQLDILYEDDQILVINKPHNVLSVPGRLTQHSILSEISRKYPDATGPLVVHRLDMSTSGILLAAKNKDSHKHLSAQFMERTVKKRYEALLEGLYDDLEKGTVELPLVSDYLNRPMQKVDLKRGKPAKTHFKVLSAEDGRSRVHFFPVTGRTHQLRVHAAHVNGLNVPIVGDDIYGRSAERLCLHAGYLEFTHPETLERLRFELEAPF